MALYSRYMVCYDIVDNKSRTKFANFLKDLGLYPIQKSVFLGELNQAELRSLSRYAHEHLDQDCDRAFWLPSDIDENRLRNGVGYNNFRIISAEGNDVI